MNDGLSSRGMAGAYRRGRELVKKLNQAPRPEPKPKDVCPACRWKDWYLTAAGHWVCGVCHPDVRETK